MKHSEDPSPSTVSKKSIGARFSSFCALAALLILFLILAYLVFLSFTGTVDMNRNNAMLENADFHADAVWQNLLSFLAFLAAALLWLLLCKRLPYAVTVGALLLTVAGFGIWFVLSSQSAPTHDSYIVSNAAYRASVGDPSALGAVYFQYFPFQLGYVLWSEGLIRLLGTGEHYLSIEIVNVLCLTLAYFALLQTVKGLWGAHTAMMCAGLMPLTLPPILFCSFTYGTVPSLAFGCLALGRC